MPNGNIAHLLTKSFALFIVWTPLLFAALVILVGVPTLSLGLAWVLGVAFWKMLIAVTATAGMTATLFLLAD